MLKAIIVDNEQPAIDVLKILLDRTEQINVAGSFLSSEDTVTALKKIKPDVAFLDIEMPKVNGLELANNILAIDSDIEIIFVTAYDHYAFDAFQVNALDYLLKPLSFEDVSQAVKRLYKRKKVILDYQPEPYNNGKIYCFNKFSVFGPGNNIPIKWRTSKSEELFAYMIHSHGCKAPKWQICEALWPYHDPEKLDIQLHTTIYKMKKALSSANIMYDFFFINGSYWLNMSNTYIDIVEFDRQVSYTKNIDSNNLEYFQNVFSLYKGDYLEENGYLWSLPQKAKYLQLYSNLAAELVRYYMSKDEYVFAETILLKQLERSPLNESANERLLQSYLARKDYPSFLTHYKTVCTLYEKELGIKPKESIQNLYEILVNKHRAIPHS